MDKPFKVYGPHREFDTTRVCDLGHKHKIAFYSVKRLSIIGERLEWVKGEHYTQDGWQPARIAMDYQGRIYESWPFYDGYGPWKRLSDGKAFSENKPSAYNSLPFTLDNKRI